jgi:hypothetical protein
MPRRSRVDRAALDALFASQDGVASFRQLKQLGMPASTLAERVGPSGRWLRLLPGVCLGTTGVATPRQRARAALLYAGEEAVLTGPEALRRYDFRSAPSAEMVHVLIPHHRRATSAGFVRVERTARMPEPVRIRGLPAAPVARAVLDTCRHIADVTSIRAVIAESVQCSRCTPAQLRDELEAGQVRGSARSRLVLREVDAGIRSVAEADARELILRSGLPEPSWNQDLFDPRGAFLARPDGWWRDAGVALEIDSREWHLDPAGWERTMRRHMRMSALGIIVLHVPPSRLRAEAGTVASQIRSALAAAQGRARPAVRYGPGGASHGPTSASLGRQGSGSRSMTGGR